MKNSPHPQFFFNHLFLNARRIKRKRTAMVTKVVNSGVYFNGAQNRKLEKNLLTFLGDGYMTTVASGHDSLFFALKSHMLSKNDEVIFPVNAYPTAFPVALSGAKPVPLDVDENGQLDLSIVETRINKNTKAIILVHLYGLVTDIGRLKEIIKGKNIVLIEDCAQAFGSMYNDKPVGTFGDISCFSFYPTKNLATLGDGGAIWTRHKNRYEFFLQAKSYGEKDKYWSSFISFHSRLPEIQAGILNLYFKNIINDFGKRKKIAKYYAALLESEKLLEYIRVLKSHPNSSPILHLFVIETNKRNALQKYLKNKKIPTYIHYPYPIHLLPAFSYLGYTKGDFPMSEHLSESILSIPFHPLLPKSSIEYIVKSVKEFYYPSKRKIQHSPIKFGLEQVHAAV